MSSCHFYWRFANPLALLVSIGLASLYSVTAQSAQTLAESAQYAIDHHPDFKSEQLRVDSAKAVVSEIDARAKPQIRLSAGIGPEQSNNATTRAVKGGSRTLNRRESSVTLRQHLFDGFGLDAQQDQVALEQDSAAHSLNLTASGLALGAIEAHLNVLLQNENLAAANASLNAHVRVYESIAERTEQGKDNRASLSQVSARLALAESNRQLSENRYSDAISDYTRRVGVAPGKLQQPDFKPKLWASYFRENSRDGFVSSVEDRSVLLKLGHLEKEIQRSGYYASKASRLPEVYLDAGASWNQDLDGLDGSNRDLFVMLKLDYDLYSGGARQAKIRQSRNALQEASFALEQDVKDVRSEAEKAWSNYQSTRERVSSLKRYVSASLETRDAYEKQFSIGYRSLLNLLDAEIELFRAQVESNEVNSLQLLSAYRMLHLDDRLLDALMINRSGGSLQ